LTFDSLRSALAWLLPACIGLYFLSRLIRFGGFKGAMFGARIRRTVGEVEGAPQTIEKVLLRVHLLESTSSERVVGLEIVGKSFASYRMLPITLSSDHTRQLIQLLQETASGV
jgi:hypothetical protein